MSRSGKPGNDPPKEPTQDAQAESLWTLHELCSQVGAALQTDYSPSENGQVSAIPSERTIRFYATLGLLDRPSRMLGRTAYYGKRHLLQLVAVKRLQAQGLSLPKVQERLFGLSQERLEDVAALPQGQARQENFWEAEPAPLPQKRDDPAHLQGIALSEMVWILVRSGTRSKSAPSSSVPSPIDQEELRKVAAPLLAYLKDRGWI